jgi:hypothetical protein
MSLTGADYFARARLGIGRESYLVDIYDSDGTARIFLAQQDVAWAAGQHYHGALLEAPQITEEIDLLRCSSGVGNVTLKATNIMLGGGLVLSSQRLLSDILRNGTGGAKHFITWQVVIYSWLGPEANANLRLELFRGRLMEVEPSGGEVTLRLEVKRPWDLISIPTVKTSRGRYFPVVYGDYTANASVPDGLDYCGSKALWPAPVDNSSTNSLLAISGHSIASNGRLHIHESATDKLVPVVDSSEDYTDTSESYGSAYALRCDGLLRHGWTFKPTNITLGYTQGSFPTSTTFSSPSSAVNGEDADETSTYATDTLTVDGVSSDYGSLFLSVPRALFPCTGENISVEVRYSATATGGSPTANLWVYAQGATGSGFVALVYDGAQRTTTVTFTSGEAPTCVLVGVATNFTPAGTVTVRIYDVKVSLISQLQTADDDQARQSAVKDVETLYSGADGLTRSWTTGTADQVHEIHRDILYRFCGVTGTPDGWSAVDTARANWDARLWLLEPTPVKDVLEKLQYEGAFVYHIRPNGTGNYIAVKSSYAAGDVAATLDVQQDCRGLMVSHTPAGDLVTKYEVDFQRHPADDSRYLGHITATGSARSDFDFGSTENIETAQLDYLVTTDSGDAQTVSAWTTYRDLLCGDVTTTATLTVVNPRFWLLEVGDIVKLSNPRPQDDPFANLTTAYYMVTKTQRKPGELGLALREVG